MHRLHNNNGVINHNANGKHKAKEGENIDGKAEQVHEKEGTENGNRHGNGWNQG